MEVVVVGSSNMDLVAYVPRLPARGETIHGDTFESGFGGKGANQAVAAAKLGGKVAMVTKVGTDSFGRDTASNYARLGISGDTVLTTPDAATGMAMICVDAHGNNSIVVVAGANNLLTPSEVESFSSLVESSAVLVCQLEIKEETTLAALALARRQGVLTIMNSAPAPASLPPAMYDLSDVFCANETEASTLTGVPVEGLEGAADAGAALIRKGCGVVVLTLGTAGALVVGRDGEEFYNVHIPAPVVPVVVDTSGAGDAFMGSFALVLARAIKHTQASSAGAGTSRAAVNATVLANRALLVHATTVACAVASDSVTRRGTQKSYPTLSDLAPGLLDTPEGLLH